MSPRGVIQLVTLIFVFIGTLFILIAMIIGNVYQKKAERCTVLTKGTIVEVHRESSHSNGDGGSSSYWYPTYEYTAESQTIRQKSSVGQGNSKAYMIGETIELYYNPDDYYEFYVPSEPIKQLVMIFKIVGGTLVVIGILVLFCKKFFK